MDITGHRNQGRQQLQRTRRTQRTLQDVAGAYVRRRQFRPVQYLTLDNMTPACRRPTATRIRRRQFRAGPGHGRVRARRSATSPLSPQTRRSSSGSAPGRRRRRRSTARLRRGPERLARTDGDGLRQVPGQHAQRKLHDAVPGSRRTRLHRLRERELQQQGRPGRVREPVHAELLGRRHLSAEHPPGRRARPALDPALHPRPERVHVARQEDVPDPPIRRLLRHRRRRHGLPRGRSPAQPREPSSAPSSGATS